MIITCTILVLTLLSKIILLKIERDKMESSLLKISGDYCDCVKLLNEEHERATLYFNKCNELVRNRGTIHGTVKTGISSSKLNSN
jgi:hypothetical protein